MGIPVLIDKAPDEFQTSSIVTAPLAAIMMMQGNALPDTEEVKNIRAESQQLKTTTLNQKATLIESTLPETTLKAVIQAKEKGASNWLSVVPLQEHGFTLNKS